MTVKFMGKATLSPPTIKEMNMSQDSVVLKFASLLEAAFSTVYLNSPLGQIQVKGKYSITKQKYINQVSIRKLKFIEFSDEFKLDLEQYLEGVNTFYTAVNQISDVIQQMNNYIGYNADNFHSFQNFFRVPGTVLPKIFTPVNYKGDFEDVLERSRITPRYLFENQLNKSKGTEIGSENYLHEGVPFVKTSDYANFGIDFQPNYYCSPSLYDELDQNLRTGDILFTKDGKIGQVAILEESSKVIYSSGSVRLRPNDPNDRNWLFLLLESNYGKILFKKWTVVASTMAHLRKHFYDDFLDVRFNENLRNAMLAELESAFQLKKKAYHLIETSKNYVLKRLEKFIDRST